MINLSEITAAVENLLKSGLSGYSIHRNAARNTNADLAARGSGWINVMRGSVDYRAHSIGDLPWMASIQVTVEVQAASMSSAEDAEDRLQNAEKAVLDVLTGDKKLGNTVDMTNGYSIKYEYNAQEKIYHHAAIITIKAEARA